VAFQGHAFTPIPASISSTAVSMLSVLTDTPGIAAPMQANILPTDLAGVVSSAPGIGHLAPGNLRPMELTSLRLIASLVKLEPPSHAISPATAKLKPIAAARTAAGDAKVQGSAQVKRATERLPPK
jgi:hypothetical protein